MECVGFRVNDRAMGLVSSPSPIMMHLNDMMFLIQVKYQSDIDAERRGSDRVSV